MTLVEFLGDPASYAEPVESVKVLQSDESWVALVGEYAYKAYRPIKRDDRDLSTSVLREKAAHREVRLNRRLGGDIYIEVLPIYLREERYSFSGDGELADVAIRMKRLPDDQMMPSILAAGGPTPAQEESLVDLLAELYASAKTVGKSSKAGTVPALDAAVRLWLAVVSQSIGEINDLARLEAALLLFLARSEAVLEKRLASGKVVECHGGLSADHICLTEPPIIIGCVDCRERHGDVLGDIAGLAVDLERRGYGATGERIWQSLAARLEEPTDSDLWEFYQAYRSLGNARLAVLNDPNTDQSNEQAQRWVTVACNHIARIYEPRLLVTVGLMGAGKTTLSEAIAGEFGITRISSEFVSKELFPPGPTGRASANRFDRHQADQVYAELLRRAEENLAQGLSVVVDASFLHQAHRHCFLEMAQRLGVKVLFLDCRLSKTDAIARLDRRFKKDRTRPGTRPEMYEDQAQLFEPLEELPPDVICALNMNQPVPRLVEIVRDAL